MFIGFRFKHAVAFFLLFLFILSAGLGGGAALRASSLKTETVRLPVLMYHSVCVNKRAGGEYVLPPEKFCADMEYLCREGYTAVFFSEVLAFTRGEASLPEKPVVVTLDDGFLNNLTVVLPVLEALDMKAEINVVGAYTQKEETAEYRSDAYSYLNAEELKTLAESGLIEIGSHTYDMHGLSGRQGCLRAAGETPAQYENALRTDIKKMRDEVLVPCGIETQIFAYPFGAVSREAQEILTDAGFTVLLTCRETVNVLSVGDTLTQLGRINRPASVSTQAFMEKFGL